MMSVFLFVAAEETCHRHSWSSVLVFISSHRNKEDKEIHSVKVMVQRCAETVMLTCFACTEELRLMPMTWMNPAPALAALSGCPLAPRDPTYR